jgi:hypothetical protein
MCWVQSIVITIIINLQNLFVNISNAICQLFTGPDISRIILYLSTKHINGGEGKDEECEMWPRPQKQMNLTPLVNVSI